MLSSRHVIAQDDLLNRWHGTVVKITYPITALTVSLVTGIAGEIQCTCTQGSGGVFHLIHAHMHVHTQIHAYRHTYTCTHLIHQLVVEVRHIQFLQTTASLTDVTRTKVLPQQQLHLQSNDRQRHIKML